uniref:Queuine tRNA-ribosyltransferase accessory subunit 2 n=1 Tax=Graphocephala atropunctata TaxID=36148 RepID=A0A1B6L868_9HEMI
MKFNVRSIDLPNCNMRIGKLSEIKRLPNTVLLTPLLLLYSKGGSVTHMTREVLEMVTNISSQAVQIPLSNSAQCYNGVKHFKEGISSFAGLPECLSYCSVQDPAEDTRVGYNEKTSISIWTHTGRKLLTAEKYMDMMEAFRPDMYQVLCDGDTNAESSRKRVQKAVDVSTTLFLECADRHVKSQSLKESALLAVVEGGYDLEARGQSAQMFSRHPAVQGFVIDGLHNNGTSVEQMAYHTIRPVITETLRHLPEDKLRVLHGSWRPDVVLELVHAGIDVFDSSLAYSATERGCALTFTYHACAHPPPTLECQCNGGIVENSKENGCCEKTKENCQPKEVQAKSCKPISNYEMNLNDKMYFDDLSPIMEDCQCLACTKHTRAYIHHLLNTREMLASVLLMIHNLHHYQKFFEAIRENGKKGQLLAIDSHPT